MTSSTSTMDSLRGFPCSREQSTAYSFTNRRTSSATRAPRRQRSWIGMERTSSLASPAPPTPRLASPRVPFGNVPRTSPEAGLVRSNVSPPSESTHFPSMYILNARFEPPFFEDFTMTSPRGGGAHPPPGEIFFRVPGGGPRRGPEKGGAGGPPRGPAGEEGYTLGGA